MNDAEQVDAVSGGARHRSTPHVSLWSSRHNRLHLFSSSIGDDRHRRATDAILLAVSFIVVAGLGVVALPPSGFERALIDLVDATPKFLDVFWDFGVAMLVAWEIVVLISAVLHRHWAVVRDMVLAALVGVGLGILVAERINGSWPGWSAIVTGGASGLVPTIGLAMLAAVSSVAKPQLSRPFRLLGPGLVAFAALSVVMVGSTTPVGAMIGLLVGSMAAAVIHLTFGSSAGRPSAADVGRGLDELGLHVVDLTAARRQSTGLFLFDGIEPDDMATSPATVGALTRRAVSVKIYGHDARDTQLVAKLWRALWYRDTGAVTLTRLQQVEHEAFVTLLAGADGDHRPRGPHRRTDRHQGRPHRRHRDRRLG